MPLGLRDRAIALRIRRHPLPREVEQTIVEEVDRCWDGVPLPRPLPTIIDQSRRLLLQQAVTARAAACDGPEATGRHIKVTALGLLEDLLSKDGSAIVITPTYGAWHSIAPALARRGYRVGVLDLRAPPRDSGARFSAAPGLDLRVLPVQGYARELVRFASGDRNVIVALCDEGRGRRFGHGALLGRTASVGSTPFELARRVGIGLLPVFAVHEKAIPRMVVEKPLKIQDTGRSALDLDTTVGRWLKLVDRWTRRHPEQYLPFLYQRAMALHTDPLPLFADASMRAAS
jgi:lauroyl/myristoyl acyltransferase